MKSKNNLTLLLEGDDPDDCVGIWGTWPAGQRTESVKTNINPALSPDIQFVCETKADITKQKSGDPLPTVSLESISPEQLQTLSSLKDKLVRPCRFIVFSLLLTFSLSLDA